MRCCPSRKVLFQELNCVGFLYQFCIPHELWCDCHWQSIILIRCAEHHPHPTRLSAGGAVRKVCRCEPVTDVTGVAAPRLDGNSLVLRPRCLKIRGIATPACALVRNDRAFSNSPLTPFAARRTARRGSFFNLPLRGRGTAAAVEEGRSTREWPIIYDRLRS